MNPINSAKTNNYLDGVHCKAHNNSEIRRFLLKVPQIHALNSHLQSLFNLQKDFVVKYRDEEGDMITIASNEDLALALMVTKGDLLRLEVSEVGDEARSGVVVSDEDGNLGKKENDEFLGGGKGRKFATKEEKRKWKRMKLESKCNDMEIEGNGSPQQFIPQNVESAPQAGVHEIKAKLFAAKERVVNQKEVLCALRNNNASEEKIKEAKESLRSAKLELFTLRKQLREWKVSMRQSKCAERMKHKAAKHPQNSGWPQIWELKMKMQDAKAKVLDRKLTLGTLRKENASEEKINEAKQNVRDAKQELFTLRKEFRGWMDNMKQSKCAERMNFKAEKFEARNAQQCNRRQRRQCNVNW